MYRQVSPNVLMGRAILSPANIWLCLVSVFWSVDRYDHFGPILKLCYPTREAAELYLTQLREYAL